MWKWNRETTFSLIFGKVVYGLRFLEILILVSVWQCLKWWIFRPQCGCDLRVPRSSEWGDPAVLLQAPGAEVCGWVRGGGGSMWHGGEVQDHCPRGHQKLPGKSTCRYLSARTCTQFILYVDKAESAQWMTLCTCNKRPTGLKGHLNSRDHIHSLHRSVFD